MIRNIPIRFKQEDVLGMIDQKFSEVYDYFYLPKDIKSRSGIGFAFINFVHPIYIIDFYHEFNCLKWSDIVQSS